MSLDVYVTLALSKLTDKNLIQELTHAFFSASNHTPKVTLFMIFTPIISLYRKIPFFYEDHFPYIFIETQNTNNTSPSPVPFTYDNTHFDLPSSVSHSSLPALPTTPTANSSLPPLRRSTRIKHPPTYL